MSDQMQIAGWVFPPGSRKCHYVEAGSMTSLCGKWGFIINAHRQADTGSAGPDDCAACRRKLDKALAVVGGDGDE